MRTWKFLALAFQTACASSIDDNPPGSGATSGGGGSASGGAPSGCSSDEKLCGGECVAISDPHYGCDSESCSPCPSHAVHLCNAGSCQFVECLPEWGDCDTDPANGCETSLAADAQNCGACGHDCAGSTCASGMCAPTEIASGLGTPLHMALRDGVLYWSEVQGTTRIRRVDTTGGTPTTLVEQSAGTFGLAVDSTHVYWLDSTGDDIGYHALRRVSKDGGAGEVVASISSAIGMVADDLHVYVFDPQELLRIAKVGGAVQSIAAPTGLSSGPGTNSAPAVAHDGNVYWVGFDTNAQPSVLSVSTGGGTIAPLATTTFPLEARITADASGVFWSENENGYRIQRAPLGGGNKSLLVDAQHPVLALTTDATAVIWADTQTIFRTHKTDGRFGTALSLAEGVVAIAADDVYAYYAGIDGSALGYLKKVAK